MPYFLKFVFDVQDSGIFSSNCKDPHGFNKLVEACRAELRTVMQRSDVILLQHTVGALPG